MVNKIFVYGTLRKGCYNHNYAYFSKNTKFIKEAVLSGAEMYDLGGYPCIVLTSNLEKEVYGEIYKYLNNDTKEKIKYMEEIAGYKEVILELMGMEVITYVYNRVPENNIKITYGDWLKYVKNKNRY